MTRFLSSFVEFGSAVSEEKSKMFQPIRGQGGQLVFPIGLKNTTKQKKQSVYNITTNEPRWDWPEWNRSYKIGPITVVPKHDIIEVHHFVFL